MTDTNTTGTGAYTERQRESLLHLIHTHQSLLDSLASLIVKAPLTSLHDPLSRVEDEATKFLTRLRAHSP